MAFDIPDVAYIKKGKHHEEIIGKCCRFYYFSDGYFSCFCHTSSGHGSEQVKGLLKPFTLGTPARAAEVNADFDTLHKNDINLNCQIQALKAIVCQDHPTASICQ